MKIADRLLHQLRGALMAPGDATWEDCLLLVRGLAGAKVAEEDDRCMWMLLMDSELKCPVVSEANVAQHRWAKTARAQQQRAVVGAALVASKVPQRPGYSRFRVTLTRLGARTLDEDNLQSAFKRIRDAVAKHLGHDDNPGSPISWVYKQEASVKYRDPNQGFRLRIEVR